MLGAQEEDRHRSAVDGIARAEVAVAAAGGHTVCCQLLDPRSISDVRGDIIEAGTASDCGWNVGIAAILTAQEEDRHRSAVDSISRAEVGTAATGSNASVVKALDPTPMRHVHRNIIEGGG